MNLSTNPTATAELLVVEGNPVKASSRLRLIGAGFATVAVLVVGTVTTVHYTGGSQHTPSQTTVQPVDAPADAPQHQVHGNL